MAIKIPILSTIFLLFCKDFPFSSWGIFVQGFPFLQPLSVSSTRFLAPPEVKVEKHTKFISCQKHISRKQHMRMLNGNDDLTIIVEEKNQDVYSMTACFVSNGGMKRTWRFRRNFEDFENLHGRLADQFGHSLIPNPPPRSLATDDVLERYLQRLAVIHQVVSSREFFDFVDIPADLVDEPVYTPEILDDDEFNFQSSSGRRRRGTLDDEDELASAAGVAGAVAGVVLAGVPGALIGAVAASVAATQDNAAGEIARSAGEKTKKALEQAKALDETYEVSQSVKKTLVKGLRKLREIAQD